MRYEWFRSYHGAPTDPKWLLIARKAGVPVHLVVAVVWALLDYASRNPDRGSIDEFDYETLSVFYGDSNESNEVSLRSVTQALQDKNIINSDLCFTKWEELQGDETHKPLTNSERQKLFRDKKKSQKEQENCKNSNENITGYNLNCNNNINNSNGIVTERNESNEYSNSVTQAVTKSNSVTTIEIENKKERKTTQKEKFIPPDWVPELQWDEWLKIRKKGSNTAFALGLAVKELAKIANLGQFTPEEILEKCILNKWQGIYPPKPEHYRSKSGVEPMPSAAGG